MSKSRAAKTNNSDAPLHAWYDVDMFRKDVVAGKHEQINANASAIRTMESQHPGLLAEAARAAAVLHDSPMTLRTLVDHFPSLTANGLVAEAAYDAGKLDCFAECLRHADGFPAMLRASRFVLERQDHFFAPHASANDRFQAVFSLTKMLHEIYPFSILVLSSRYLDQAMTRGILDEPRAVAPLLDSLNALRVAAVADGAVASLAEAEAAVPLAQVVGWPLYLFSRYVVFDVDLAAEIEIAAVAGTTALSELGSSARADHHVWAQMIAFSRSEAMLSRSPGAQKLFCDAMDVSLRFFSGEWKSKVELHMHTYCQDTRLSQPHQRPIAGGSQLATVQKLRIPYDRFCDRMHEFLCAMQALHTVLTVPLRSADRRAPGACGQPAPSSSSPSPASMENDNTTRGTEGQDPRGPCDRALIHGLFGRYLFDDNEVNVPGLRLYAHTLFFWFAYVCPRATQVSDWDVRAVELQAAQLADALGPHVFTLYGFLLTEYKYLPSDMHTLSVEMRAKKYDSELFSLNALVRVFGEACRQSAARPRAASVLERWLAKKKRAAFLAKRNGVMFQYFLAGTQETAFSLLPSPSVLLSADAPMLLLALLEFINVQYRSLDEEKAEAEAEAEAEAKAAGEETQMQSQNDDDGYVVYMRWLFHIHTLLVNQRHAEVRALYDATIRAVMRRAFDVRGRVDGVGSGLSQHADVQRALDLVQSLRVRAFGFADGGDGSSSSSVSSVSSSAFNADLATRMQGVQHVVGVHARLMQTCVPRMRAIEREESETGGLSFLLETARVLRVADEDEKEKEKRTMKKKKKRKTTERTPRLVYLLWRFALDSVRELESPVEKDATAFLHLTNQLHLTTLTPTGDALSMRRLLSAFCRCALLGRARPLQARWLWYTAICASNDLAETHTEKNWVPYLPEPHLLFRGLVRKVLLRREPFTSVLLPIPADMLAEWLLTTCAPGDDKPRLATDVARAALIHAQKIGDDQLFVQLMKRCAVRYPDYLPLLRLCVFGPAQYGVNVVSHASDQMIAYAALFRKHLLLPSQQEKLLPVYEARLEVAFRGCYDKSPGDTVVMVGTSVSRILAEADAQTYREPLVPSPSPSFPFLVGGEFALEALREIVRLLLARATGPVAEMVTAAIEVWLQRTRFVRADFPAGGSCLDDLRELAEEVPARYRPVLGLVFDAVRRAEILGLGEEDGDDDDDDCAKMRLRRHEFLFNALDGAIKDPVARLTFLRRYVYASTSAAALPGDDTNAAATWFLFEHARAGRVPLALYRTRPYDRVFAPCVIWSPGFRRSWAKTVRLLVGTGGVSSSTFRELVGNAARRRDWSSRALNRVMVLLFWTVDAESPVLLRDRERIFAAHPSLKEVYEEDMLELRVSHDSYESFRARAALDEHRLFVGAADRRRRCATEDEEEHDDNKQWV